MMMKLQLLLFTAIVAMVTVKVESSDPIISRANVTTDPCQQPKTAGPCKGLFPRYFYNTQTSVCETFNYGGCWGNDNNFETQVLCETACMGGK